jgi:hypothetical protein
MAGAQARDDFVCALARDPELAADLRDVGRVLAAHTQHAAVGKLAVGEASGGHRGIESLLVPDPGAPQCRSEVQVFCRGRARRRRRV